MSAPARAQGVITACTDGRITCHRADLKNVRWVFHGPGKALVEPVVCDGRLLAAFAPGGLVCLDILTGKELWHTDLGPSGTSGLTAGSGRVYIGSGDGWVRAFDLADGGMIWHRDTESFVNIPPVLHENVLLVVSNRALLQLELGDGKVLDTQTVDSVISTPPSAEGMHVCFGTENGELHYRKLGAAEDEWIYHSGDAITTKPLMTADRIYISDAKGQFSAVHR